MSGLIAHRGLLLNSGPPPPPAGFWDAIADISPEVLLHLNDASGSTAVNSGSGSNGTINGAGVQYLQGSLCSSEPSANSIATDATGEYVTVPISGIGSTPVIGFCYAGTGAGNDTARILFRTEFTNSGVGYLRIDMTNILFQFNGSTGAINTGVASSILKDGNPHLVILGTLTGDTGNFRMWIDGTNVWTYSLGAVFLQTGSTFVLARNGNTTQYTYGRYADLFIRSGSITSTQMNAINSAWAP